MTDQFMIANPETAETVSIMSDMYKDAYGFRPRGRNYHLWTQAELDAEIDSLQAVIESNMVEEEIYIQARIVEFNELLEKTINLGAGNRETALRWLYDGSGIGEVNSSQDLEHFVWQNGFLFSEYGKNIVKELIKIYGDV